MIKTIIKFGFSEGLTKALPFVTALFVAKMVSPSTYGSFALLLVLFEILFIIISINIQATTRIDYFKFEPDEFWDSKIKHLQFSLIFSLLTILVVLNLTDLNLTLTIIMVASVLLRTISVFITAYFQCEGKVFNYALSNVTFASFLAVATIFLFYLNYNYVNWVLCLFTASLAQLIITIIIFTKSSRLPNKLSFKIFTTNDLLVLQSALLFTPQAIAWWLRSGAERVLIESHLSSEILGNYALAAQVAGVLIIIVSTMNLVVVPEVNKKLQQGSYIYVRRLLFKISFLLLLVSCVFFYLSQWILGVILPETYVFVTEYTLLSIVSTAPQLIMMLYINVLYFKGKGAYVAKLILIGYLVYFLLLALLLKDFGMYFLFGLLGVINSFMLFYTLTVSRSCFKAESREC